MKTIRLLMPENFDEEVIEQKNAILILCMPDDDDFACQIKVLEIVAKRHESWLRVGIVRDPFVEHFKKKLNIIGTPTFLVFCNGKEVNRKLGMLDSKSLEDFVYEIKNQQ